MMMLNQPSIQLSAQEHHQVLQKQQSLIWDEVYLHPVPAPKLMIVPAPLKKLMLQQMWRNLQGQHHLRLVLQQVPPLEVVEFNVSSAWEDAMSSRIILTIELGLLLKMEDMIQLVKESVNFLLKMMRLMQHMKLKMLTTKLILLRLVTQL